MAPVVFSVSGACARVHTYARAHTHPHTHTSPVRAPAGLPAHTHTRTHTHTHTHTHSHGTQARVKKPASTMGILDWARGLIERNMQSAADRDAWWTAYVRGVDTARRDM